MPLLLCRAETLREVRLLAHVSLFHVWQLGGAGLVLPHSALDLSDLAE